ncbi:MAG: DUF4258 domain-containing protein [bacterium]
MKISFHPHALERIIERGTTEDEVRAAIEGGERFPAKYNRTGFRRNFPFDSNWHGKYYKNKQVEAYAVDENATWVVITIITPYF